MRTRNILALAAAAQSVALMAQDNGAAVTLPMPEPRPVVVGEPAQPWYRNVNVKGFAMIDFHTIRQDGANTTSFGINMARIALSGPIDAGRAGTFNWCAQLQVNGNVTSLGSSARLVDVFVEWRKLDFIRVTAGEFSLPFTLENDIHPVDLGFSDNSVPVLKLCAYSDRSGLRSSNGRDIGLSLAGDALFASDGHPVLQYNVAVVNGQGINTGDVDDNKTVVGRLNIEPVKGVRLSVSGLEGSVAREGELKAADGRDSVTVTRSLYQHRYAIGAEWVTDDIVLRGEYIHSTGSGFAVRDDGHTRDLTLSGLGDKADGFYAMALVRIMKSALPGPLRVKGRYDLYRPEACTASSQSTLQLGADYWFTRNVGIMFEYSHVNDRSLARHNYNGYVMQVQLRF